MDMENGVVTRRLRSCNSFQFGNIARSTESFSSQLNVQSEETQHAVFKLLIEEEASLVLEYNALRALLKQALMPPITVDKKTLLKLVHEALDLAQLLTKKYDLYINEHPSFLSKRALEKHQESYTRWINSAAPVYTKKKARTWQEWFNAGFTTEKMNPRRLYILRERRLLLLLVPVIKNFGNYSSWILWADAYVGPCLAYLNILFFLPRLAFNLYTLFSNVFDKSKMRPEARNLDPLTRFMAQWNRLWPQIMNDVAWAISGTLMCFVFIGAWQPLGIFLAVAMQFYDLLLASIRIGMDLNRLNQLEEQYNNMAKDPDLPLDARYRDLHPKYCLHLNKGIAREKSLLYLAFANALVLFVAMCLALPVAVAISPLLPIIGAVMAILMTVINFQGRSYLNTPEFKTLENLLELGQPTCPVAKSRANSVDTFNFSPHPTSVSLPMPPLQRAQSSGNTPYFFSSNIPTRSRSDTDLKSLSDSPSPTGIDVSLSRDDLDAYMIGGRRL